MTMPEWWRRRRVRVGVLAVVLVYGVLRAQIWIYEWQIRKTEGALEQLRPSVRNVLQIKEMTATAQAQERFGQAVKAAALDWEGLFQGLSAAIPPSLVVNTLTLEDGTRMTLRGILRQPPPEPQAYLAAVAARLKQTGVYQDIRIAVAPHDPDDPDVARVDVIGELR